MKLIEMKCKNCGARLKVNSEIKEANCQFCGTIFKMDDEVKHIQYDNVEQAGYEFEKGRIRAQREKLNNSTNVNSNYQYNQKKNNKMVWLILAWIFLFPFTLTYYIIKSEKLDKKKKIVIITILWIVFLIIGLTNDTEHKQIKNNFSNEYIQKIRKL